MLRERKSKCEGFVETLEERGFGGLATRGFAVSELGGK